MYIGYYERDSETKKPMFCVVLEGTQETIRRVLATSAYFKDKVDKKIYITLTNNQAQNPYIVVQYLKDQYLYGKLKPSDIKIIKCCGGR